MKISKKIAVAAIPAVMALASTNVDSKILLMSQEGWEVSFDGAANAFIMKNSVLMHLIYIRWFSSFTLIHRWYGLWAVTMIQVLLLVYYQMFGV